MPEERVRDVLHSLPPTYRLLVFILFGLIPSMIFGLILHVWSDGENSSHYAPYHCEMIVNLGEAFAILLVSLFMVVAADRRPLGSFGLRLDRLAIRDFGIGLLVSSLQIGIILAFYNWMGWIHLKAINWDPDHLGRAIGSWFGFVLIIELVFRGYIFQCVLMIGGRKFGPLLALGITSAILGLSFAWGDPIISSSLIVSGLELGVAYLVTRRLWLPIGMQLAWYLIQTTILGLQDSPGHYQPLLPIEPTDPGSWAGLGIGANMRLIAAALSSLDIALLLCLNHLGFWRPEPYPSDYLPRKPIEFIEDPLLS